MPQKMEKDELQKKAFSSAAWKFFERVCAQLVSLTVSIVLARILLPDDYSVVSIVSIFFQFSNIVISGGFSAALIQKQDADDLDYSSVMVATIGMSAIIYVVLFVFSGEIANIYNKPSLIPVIRVMGLILFVNAYKSILCARVSSNLEFKKFFLSTIGGTIISAIVGIIMAYYGFGHWALVAQQMTNSTIDTLILSFTTKYKIHIVVSLKRLKKLFSFGGKIYVASIISVAYEQVRPLIVGVKYSPTDLAYYNKGNSFPQILNSSISETVSAVLFPVISKVQDNYDTVKSMTRRYMRTISYVVFPLMIGFCAVADSFVVLLLTEKWLPIVPYIRIFSICYMFDVIITGNLQAIRAIGRSDVILKLEVIKKVSYIIVIIGFVIFANSPIQIAAASIVTTVLACIINAFPNRKIIRYSYIEQLKDISNNLFISIVTGGIVWAFHNLQIAPIAKLAIQVIVGIVVYLLLSIICRNENLHYLLSIIKSRKHRIRSKENGLD